MTNRFMPSPTLRRIARGQLCSGCGGCAAVAPGVIEMARVDPGYLRPVQSASLSPEQEAWIAGICPGLRLKQEPAGRTDHELWGPVVAARTGHATDPELRRNASSGGALSAILVHLLETGQVDRVLQTAAAVDLPVANRTVTSIDAAQVFAAAGSRYAPSAPLDGLEDWLAGDERLAFVGKPCDVAALRQLAKTDPRVAERFPVVLSFFCAGVPSLTGAGKVLERMGAPAEDVTAFRYRGDGWPGFARADMADGSSRRMSYADSWGGILSKHVQFRCKICPDGTGGFADIVCADAWETDADGYPLFEERDGTSLVLSRTEIGERIVTQAAAAGALSAAAFDLSALRAMQPGQVRKRQLALARMFAMRVTGRPVPNFRGFHLVRNAREAGAVQLLRNFLGTLRRIVRGRTEAP